MKIVSVSVSGLKNNPSQALRDFHEDLVLVMNRNELQAKLYQHLSSYLVGKIY